MLIRPLTIYDDFNQVCKCLEPLCKDVDVGSAKKAYEHILNMHTGIYIYVAEISLKDELPPLKRGTYYHKTGTGELLGIGTLLCEPKLIHNFSRVGHIEDISVRKDCQAQGVGKEIINRLIEKAKDLECYKIILDCSDDLVKYYEKFGFSKVGNYMRKDF